MAGNSKYFIYDMADLESSRRRTSKFSNFFVSIEFYAFRRAYSNHCGSVQNCKARLIDIELNRRISEIIFTCSYEKYRTIYAGAWWWQLGVHGPRIMRCALSNHPPANIYHGRDAGKHDLGNAPTVLLFCILNWQGYKK